MNVIDEAFIRAYQPDAAPATPPIHRQEAAARVDGPPLPDVVQCAPLASPAAQPEIAIAGAGGDSSSLFFEVTSADIPSETPPPEAFTTTLPRESLAPAPAESLVAETPSTRRPLSSFVQPPRSVEAVFRPELEVDAFRWPDVCVDLTTHWAENFTELLTAIIAASEGGRSLIGVAGLSEGVGATTLALCLARLATQAGKTTVLVDGNFTDPCLATRLGLEVDSGWEQVLSGATPLASSVIHSEGDALALLPLIAGGLRASEQIDTIHASVTAGVLRYHYDLVLIDLGSVAGGGQTAVARKLAQQLRLDACVLTSGQAEPGLLAQFAASVPELADILLGVVENQTVLAAAG